MNLKTSTFLEFWSNKHLHYICEFLKQSLGKIISHHGYDLFERTYLNEPWRFYLKTSSPTLLSIFKDLTCMKPRKCEQMKVIWSYIVKIIWLWNKFNIVALALTTLEENAFMAIIIGYSSRNILVFIDLFLTPCFFCEK